MSTHRGLLFDCWLLGIRPASVRCLTACSGSTPSLLTLQVTAPQLSADQGQQQHELFGCDIFGNMCLEKCIPGFCSTVSSQQYCTVSTLFFAVILVKTKMLMAVLRVGLLEVWTDRKAFLAWPVRPLLSYFYIDMFLLLCYTFRVTVVGFTTEIKIS